MLVLLLLVVVLRGMLRGITTHRKLLLRVRSRRSNSKTLNPLLLRPPRISQARTPSSFSSTNRGKAHPGVDRGNERKNKN